MAMHKYGKFNIEIATIPTMPKESWKMKIIRSLPSSRRFGRDDMMTRKAKSVTALNDSASSGNKLGISGDRLHSCHSLSSRGIGDVDSATGGEILINSELQRPKRRSRRTARSLSNGGENGKALRRKPSLHTLETSTTDFNNNNDSLDTSRRSNQRKRPHVSPIMLPQRQMSGILTRFLTSTSKPKSTPPSSGDSGETEPDNSGDGVVVGHLSPGNGSSLFSPLAAPRQQPRSHRSTLDSNDSQTPGTTPTTPSPPNFLAPITKLQSTVIASSRNLLATAAASVPVSRRRYSSDGSVSAFSSHTGRLSRRGSNGSLLPDEHAEQDYGTKQSRLQSLADDLHKCGELDKAVEVWSESLELAEQNKDSLSSRTEILCILMDLHFQLSQDPGNSNVENTAEEEKQQEDIPSRVRRPRSPANSKNFTNSHHSTITLEEDVPQIKSRGSAYHERKAMRYVHRIKPALVKPAWIGCNVPLMEFLTRAEAWELALLVASKLLQDSVPGREPQVEAHQLATLHFQVAYQKLDSHRQGEALQHLQATVKNLQQIPISKRDMVMYLQVLQLVATEYQQQGSPSLALEAYEEQLHHASADEQAFICCQMAEILISERQLDMALEKLEFAAQIMDKEGNSGVIRLQLLQAKGDVLYRLGRMDESMQVYQKAFEEAKNAADKAKLLYTMGRLCIRLRRIREAISFFTRELEITQKELGINHLSVSHIYHELANLYDEGLGEHKMALMKYNKALQIELAVLQECHFGVATCKKCNPVAHRMCDTHSNMHAQVTGQIRETKKSQGRMHFKLGDFDKALKTSFFNDHAPAGVSRRASRTIPIH